MIKKYICWNPEYRLKEDGLTIEAVYPESAASEYACRMDWNDAEFHTEQTVLVEDMETGAEFEYLVKGREEFLYTAHEKEKTEPDPSLKVTVSLSPEFPIDDEEIDTDATIVEWSEDGWDHRAYRKDCVLCVEDRFSNPSYDWLPSQWDGDSIIGSLVDSIIRNKVRCIKK
jgi:hypothetical protein